MPTGTSARLERLLSATSNFRSAPRARERRREPLRRRQRASEFHVAAPGRRGPSTRTRFLAGESGEQAPPCGAAPYQKRHREPLPLAPPRLEKDRSAVHDTGSYCPSAVPPFRSVPFHPKRCVLSVA